MSDAIVIILGSRSTGTILAKAASRIDANSFGDSDSDAVPPTRRIHVVPHYSKGRRPPPLLDIEKAVVKAMGKINHGTAENIAGILFAYSDKESTGFPFESGTRFLNFTGHSLFQKLIVVRSSFDHDLTGKWDHLVAEGMRTTSLDGEPDSAASIIRQLVDRWSLFSVPQTSQDDCDSDSSSPTVAGDGHDPETMGTSDEPSQIYAEMAHGTGRHPDQAVVLLLGRSGHGKSKTINRLIGQNLLKFGQSASGSTTKVIQRVKIPVYDRETETTVTLAFDDTPGDADTDYEDRAVNTNLIRIYKERYFPNSKPTGNSLPEVCRQTYPNVILLVASWRTITPDAHNGPTTFTSALGKSMYSLSCSDLVDRDRTNVIVVITKSMSSWYEFDDYHTAEEKHKQWKIEAGRRKGIITELQRKVFPGVSPWQIVFVENGGGTKMREKYPILPNGELSHQNLFEAIRHVIEEPGLNGTYDMAGMYALDALTGAEPLDASGQATTEILVDKSDTGGAPNGTHDPPGVRALEESETQLITSASPRIQDLVNTYLGVTYNPISGHYGRTRVVSLNLSSIRLGGGPDIQMEHFEHVADAQQERGDAGKRLRADFKIPDVAAFSAHYATASALQSSWTNNSQLYVAKHVTATVTARGLSPTLSQEMLDLIRRLPRWSSSEKVKRQYFKFFASHGTHVVLRLALGGSMRVVVHDLHEFAHSGHGRKIKAEATVPALEGFMDVGVGADYERNYGAGAARGRWDISIFRDGGGAVACDLTGVLEKHFKQAPPGTQAEYPWPNVEVRQKWVKALKTDPTFCPDNNVTDFEWLYALGGLSEDQENDLRDASESYLRMRHNEKESAPPPYGGVETEIPREKNSKKVRQKIRNFCRKVFGRRG